MHPNQDNNATLAVLIDADNANPAIISGLLEEVAKLGIASVKRIYGDWTTPNLGSWKQVLLKHSIQPIQQFSYTSGKNATDSAMIIDAMDLLYAGHFDGFCIVSSDSDFTRLAARIRESGRRVYGFGEKKTPRPFVAACDLFIYTEVFVQKPGEAQNGVIKRRSEKELRADAALLNLLRNSVEAAADESGWAKLGVVGGFITRTVNDFDVRSYGYSKLSSLLGAIKLFDVERREDQIFVRSAKTADTEMRTEDGAEKGADKAQDKPAGNPAKQENKGKNKQKKRQKGANPNPPPAAATAAAPAAATEQAPAASLQTSPATVQESSAPVKSEPKATSKQPAKKRKQLLQAVTEAVMEAAASVAAATQAPAKAAAKRSRSQAKTEQPQADNAQEGAASQAKKPRATRKKSAA
ncbi:NYN domain-containing protein [Massilia sp. W12]|uniref:NYN domain-containing protein n=1 Tax=Massilia sp. W12 TaxID=3126507 RepID=UPI0030CC5F6F